MRRSCGGDARAPRRLRDRGTTFVEVLVSIVLIGTVVGGTLTALRTTIVSSRIDENQTTAHARLVTAQDAIYRTPYLPCTSFNVAEITAAYDNAVQAALPPDGWTGGVNVVYFWSKDISGAPVWGTVCGTAVSAQVVETYILSPSGDVTKRIQVVKDAG